MTEMDGLPQEVTELLTDAQVALNNLDEVIERILEHDTPDDDDLRLDIASWVDDIEDTALRLSQALRFRLQPIEKGTP